jgi:hypothetical protein
VKQRFNPVNAVEKRRNACGALGRCDKQSCVVSEGTPDLSGRAFNHAGLLPHECGVPIVASTENLLGSN